MTATNNTTITNADLLKQIRDLEYALQRITSADGPFGESTAVERGASAMPGNAMEATRFSGPIAASPSTDHSRRG